MTTPLIRVRELRVGYGETVLLDSATFDVEQGDIFIILGGSGCGKSTLLRHLVGLDPPMSGEIAIAGIGAPRLEGSVPRYGVMFQSGALFSSMTVGETSPLLSTNGPSCHPTQSWRSCVPSWRWSGSKALKTSCRPSSPAVCASAPRLPARWRSSPT